MQLAIPLTRSGEPLFRQVYSGLREAILAGSFAPGEKLPSTRDLAEELGISRTVALLAYDQLLAEGFAEGRRGSGTYVAIGVTGSVAAHPERARKLRLAQFGRFASRARVSVPSQGAGRVAVDFAFGVSDLANFPFAMWRRLLLKHARRAPVREIDYGAPSGTPALREAICGHVRRSRAVVCDASQVLVANGSQQALDLIARVLIERGDRVAVEDPMYQGTREVLRAAGARMIPVTVDRDGIRTAKLPGQVRLAFVTPSHQFPTGAILSLARRMELLDWAKRWNAVIVEDDYDGEFRYEGQPLESLQGLDREGRVVYIGTFSRTVFPALRIGYLIAPKELVPAFTAAKWLCDRHTPTLEQETLAEFISSGMYERYLRKVRRRNAARRETLLDAIRSYAGDRVEMTGDGAGAHVVLWPRHRVNEEEIVTKAAAKSVGVYGIAPYSLRGLRRAGIMLGYARLREAEIKEGIRRLAEVL